MLRDEADILPVWLRHMTALCDQIFAVDHLSNDGSSETLNRFIEAGLPIRSWRMDEPGYWQSAVTTELARFAFQSCAEWVLPLDVDEFLDIESKENLRALLGQQMEPLAFWRWRHAVPSEESLATGNIDWSSPQLLANPNPAPGNGGKVVLHRSVYHKLPGFRLGSGNHLLHGAPFAKAIRGDALGTLWHLPVRSRKQILRKLHRDLASHTNAQSTTLPELGGVALLKAQLLERISHSADDFALLQRMGIGYGELGMRCFDDSELLVRAVRVCPSFVMAEIPSLSFDQALPAQGMPSLPSYDSTTHVLTKARLSAKMVEITPEGTWARFLLGLENSLLKFFTPGLRLARFLATRFVAWRLDMPVRTKN